VAISPPTLWHRQLAIAVLVITLAAMGGVIPFANAPLPRVDSFIPTIMAITFVTDLVTAVLLFGQFSATGSKALLVLASGYLFSSLIVVPHALTFPGAFSPTGLLGAGAQSAAWLNVCWRLGLAVALAGYGILRSTERTQAVNEAPRQAAIYWRVSGVVLLVFALTIAATAGDRFIPRLIVDGRIAPLGHYLNATIALTNMLALGLIITRKKSTLDIWLLVAICALICEAAMVALFIKSRFSFGFYSIRIISLLVSKVVLIVLLSETMRLYTKLLAANRDLRSERANKLASAEAAVAAVAHEVKQPLTSMIARADAGRTILDRALPNVAGAATLFKQIKSDAFRVNEVFTGLRSMFSENSQRLGSVDLNQLVLESVQLMRNELLQHRIVVDAKLASELPPVSGSHEQLREVFLNLIQNAIEAIITTKKNPRVISVASKSSDSNSVVISFEDTGPGVDPQKLSSIFDAFVTTKAHGTGLGLGICKMIVDRHGGTLSAAAGPGGGARFDVTLPTIGVAPGRAEHHAQHASEHV
jgi:signal transduction histidine kinase